MKIEYIDNKYVVYLNKYYYEFDKNTINNCIFKILKKLKKIYNIEIYSTFNIECYISNVYGIVLEIKKEYDPFSKYAKNTDININYHYNKFLFEVSDYFIKDKLNCNIYIYNSKYYIDIYNDYISEYITDIVYKNN